MEGLVKIGPWGGSGGDPRDDIVAAGVAPHRLQSVVIRCQGAVDAISFTYAGVDGAPRMVGPSHNSSSFSFFLSWWQAGHMFGAGEFVKEISGTYGPFGGHTVVRSLTFVTNIGKHGPFGTPWQTPFSVPVQDGAHVVGFFGRSGSLLDAVGVYVHP
ncbi:salt stress-induced protein [Setaria italica]|uniref:salt stress-induced protein n=1 Tax=Setaria italica TaxID=4555 RepID=UPI000BE539EF|nr:salt stress-induced protein [Setaria italica]